MTHLIAIVYTVVVVYLFVEHMDRQFKVGRSVVEDLRGEFK